MFMYVGMNVYVYVCGGMCMFMCVGLNTYACAMCECSW
jgi:hypothetical protein